MKKTILTVLSILVIASTINTAHSKTVVSNDLSNAIRLYKAGNYTECYVKLDNILKKDSSNAIAYYYMAMTSAQLGKKNEAIANYDKVIALTTSNNNLRRYARKGKTCLEDPNNCNDRMNESELDTFIRNKSASFSSEVKGEFERLKIENMMREINRNSDIDPQKFKEYKDFSSIETPSNDEIVAAIRTLQKAGLGNIFSNSGNDLSMITGTNSYNPMLNLMGGNSMNPQLIQALLTNSMTQGF